MSWLILWAIFAALVYGVTTWLYGDMDDLADKPAGDGLAGENEVFRGQISADQRTKNATTSKVSKSRYLDPITQQNTLKNSN